MAANTKGRDINGVVLLNKDSGISSNKALQQVKKLFFAKKAGHTGSLDPLARGILPICMGSATKIAGFLLKEDKRYLVYAQLGQTTDTGDSSGVVTSKKIFTDLKADKIIETVKSFIGKSMQIPPMYSALKKNGKPLYKLARQGITVSRQERLIVIHKIHMLVYKDGILEFELTCSKGTYIRTLVEDIGAKLGCGAFVVKLKRTGFADFNISDTYKLSALAKLKNSNYEELDKVILASEAMLPNIISMRLNLAQSNDIKNGKKINITKNILRQNIKLFDEKKIFFAIGIIEENGDIAPKRVFI